MKPSQFVMILVAILAVGVAIRFAPESKSDDASREAIARLESTVDQLNRALAQHEQTILELQLKLDTLPASSPRTSADEIERAVAQALTEKMKEIDVQRAMEGEMTRGVTAASAGGEKLDL